eukprot:TRINITY_DN1886_c0_g1_i1.p2 TRINITY_DN1886_c0_g1~~TRINITY_DN1886_c0_g1_i1.p2  ORF type:complete len:311 (-),score=127.34 TRINITY_DN1886_c0_g1_i1:1039-1902(-)
MGDDLFDVHTNYLLGSYSAALSEAEKSKSTSVEKSFLVYRSYIGLADYNTVIVELADAEEPELQAVRVLAQYLNAAEQEQPVAQHVAEMEKLVQEKGFSQGVLVVGATLYALEGDRDQCVRIAHQSESLEAKAILVQQYLASGRVDMADKEYKKMCAADEDAVVTQLAGAWLCLNKGAKVQEGDYIFQDLGEKYGRTPAVLNGHALCFMHRGSFDDAEPLLREALEKNTKYADTLANLVVCSQHLNKQPLRFLRQLKGVAPGHPLVKDVDALEHGFDRACARYAAAK